MDPFVRLFLLLWFGVGVSFAIHWFFMRDYRRWKRLNRAEKSLRDAPSPPPRP